LARSETIYVCSECGSRFHRWSGRCPNCGMWNSLEEEVVVSRAGARFQSQRSGPAEVFSLAEVEGAQELRVPTGLGEFDRVLGGGVLPGSTILLGGEPGIGKSTIMLQALGHIAGAGGKCLYVTCEESLAQFKMRAARLGVDTAPMLVSPHTELESICSLLSTHQPAVAVVDSVQMVNTGALDSPVGSLAQLKTCSGELIRLAKMENVALFLVGHVTKQGAIAGPRALEHMVDTVLYFESQKTQALRVLRAAKNRFGSVNEIGVFQMGECGLREVPNPSELFLAERESASSGSVVTSTIEGSRAVLVEIQALVGPAAYGTPERRASGTDHRRMSMMLAVLQRRTGLNLGSCDTFVNVAGGVRVVEPAADLPLALAIVSSYRERPFPADAVAIGEVGLGGEVRAVGRMAERLQEARKLGFSQALIPKSNAREGAALMDIVPVRNLREALRVLENP